MVALADAGSKIGSFCGGTLVASKYVISAAHCMFDENNVSLKITGFQVRTNHLIL